MDLNKSLKNYLDELSSASPTPGGGNVAAMCGVLASSLSIMVCNLTIGKKKYQEVEAEVIQLKEKFESYKSEFEELARKDNEAFDKVMEAFKLPKETDEQKVMRRDAIENATLEAAIVPSNVIKTCRDILPLIEKLADIGNQNSLSDAGVAVSLVSTAAQGAYLNVVINCVSMSNQLVANEFLKKSEILQEEVKTNSETIVSAIVSKIRNQ
jgi:formiminotetrahydrofolate cyclodeaminase